MSLIRHLKISLLALLLLMGPVQAGDNGTSAAQFLRIGVGARAAGMGEAFCAVADDVTAIHWNPAGLARICRNEATFTHIEWFQGIGYEFLGYALPVGECGSIGVGYYLLHAGEITKTLEDAWGIYAGEDGKFTAKDQALTVSYGHELGEAISLGAGLKLIYQENAGRTAKGYGLDLGGIYKTPLQGLNMGFSIQNVGPGIRFITQKDPLPFNIKVGGAYRMLSRSLIVAVDVDFPSDDDFHYHAGIEYRIQDIVALRTGYNSQADGNQSHSSVLGGAIGAGFGIDLSPLSLDASYVPYGDLGKTYSVSLSIEFGARRKGD